uniref:Uncharacterized protein n=1 Tax=Branchiostoma floridae TaxID=7739 RepID=C3XS85_BRAFL|eukprot:XP_002613091.1 hypothetical protein BRAFLDRAFT_89973 [Branchiostoma floridae]
MRDYVVAVDAELNETRPLADASSDVTYPVTKYQVSPDRKPSSAGEYLFPPARFTICNGMRACAFSVTVKDNIAPQLVHCPFSYHHLQGDRCRDVNVYGYYSTSEMTSWFRDNVGIKEVHFCPPLRPPKFGALVCHEDQPEKKCILFCTEGKLHTKPNIFRCDMSEPSPTWIGAHGTTVDRVNCKDNSRHELQFTVNTTCTPDDEAFYNEVQQTLSDTKGEHHLCYNVSDVDCDITVTCANYSNQGDDKPPKAEINEKSKLPLASVIAAASVLCVVAIVITFIIIIKKKKKAPVADAYRSQDLEPDPVVPGDSVKCSKALKNKGQRDKFLPSMEEQLVKIE